MKCLRWHTCPKFRYALKKKSAFQILGLHAFFCCALKPICFVCSLDALNLLFIACWCTFHIKTFVQYHSYWFIHSFDRELTLLSIKVHIFCLTFLTALPKSSRSFVIPVSIVLLKHFFRDSTFSFSRYEILSCMSVQHTSHLKNTQSEYLQSNGPKSWLVVCMGCGIHCRIHHHT